MSNDQRPLSNLLDHFFSLKAPSTRTSLWSIFYIVKSIDSWLQECLDELLQLQMLSPALALRVLIQFDKSINTALATRVKNKLHFKADKLNTYRFCDNVWTFMLKEVEFRENLEFAKVDRVKIVACDAKSSGSSRADAEWTQKYFYLKNFDTVRWKWKLWILLIHGNICTKLVKCVYIKFYFELVCRRNIIF